MGLGRPEDKLPENGSPGSFNSSPLDPGLRLMLRARTWKSGLRYGATAPCKQLGGSAGAEANGERISRSVQFCRLR